MQAQLNLFSPITLNIKVKKDRLEEYTLEDFELIDYKHNDSLPMKMRV